MSFAQFHDGFYRNPKVRKAGSLGAWMWAASIGYASENLTDGFIPSHELAALCSDLDTKPRLKVAAKLVEVGLWEVVDGGWRIHDYLNWNLSKAAILAKREANLARVNKHRGKAPRHGEGNARVMHYNEHYTGGDSARTNAPPSDPTSSDPSPLAGGVPARPPAREADDLPADIGGFTLDHAEEVLHTIRDRSRGKFSTRSVVGQLKRFHALCCDLIDGGATREEFERIGDHIRHGGMAWAKNPDVGLLIAEGKDQRGPQLPRLLAEIDACEECRRALGRRPAGPSAPDLPPPPPPVDPATLPPPLTPEQVRASRPAFFRNRPDAPAGAPDAK